MRLFICLLLLGLPSVYLPFENNPLFVSDVKWVYSLIFFLPLIFGLCRICRTVLIPWSGKEIFFLVFLLCAVLSSCLVNYRAVTVYKFVLFLPVFASFYCGKYIRLHNWDRMFRYMAVSGVLAAVILTFFSRGIDISSKTAMIHSVASFANRSNFAGALFVCLTLIAGFIFYEKSLVRKSLFLGLFIILSMILFQLFLRTYWVLYCLMILMMMRIYAKQADNRRILVGFSLAAVVSCVSVVLLFFESITKRFMTIFTLEHVSIAKRLLLWMCAKDIIAVHPFWGAGMGQFEYVHSKYLLENWESLRRVLPITVFQNGLSEAVAVNVHNDILEFACDFGAAAALSLLLFVCFTLYGCFLRRAGSPSGKGIMIIGVVCLCMCLAGLLHSTAHHPVTAVYFFMSLGILQNESRFSTKTRSEDGHSLYAILSAAVFLFSAHFGIRGVMGNYYFERAGSIPSDNPSLKKTYYRLAAHYKPIEYRI